MNSALQALCNIPPLREHFTQTYFPTMVDDKKHCLSRNFQRLIEDMCQPDGPAYLVPSGILYGIRSVSRMNYSHIGHEGYGVRRNLLIFIFIMKEVARD